MRLAVLSAALAVERWLKDVERYSSRDVSVLLVGAKCDLVNERAVTEAQGKDLAERSKYCKARPPSPSR